MNLLIKTVVLLLVLFIICVPVHAEQMNETEVVLSWGEEITYFHGPIPIALASPTENDISEEQALRIAREVAAEEGTVSEETLAQCMRSVHYVTLSNIKESYHIGGWVITYFLEDSQRDVRTVILEGASGAVLFTTRGREVEVGWSTPGGKKQIRLGSLGFLWPVEWRATFETVFVFPNPENFRHVLPTENDISQAEALAIAKTALREVARVSDQKIEQYLVNYWLVSDWIFYDTGTTDTVWNLGFMSMEQDGWGNWIPVAQYCVIMSSKDGTVMSVTTP